jgi:hypothetical protein
VARLPFSQTSEDKAFRAVISVIEFSLLSILDFYLRSKLSSRRPVSPFNPLRNEISLSYELLSSYKMSYLMLPLGLELN